MSKMEKDLVRQAKLKAARFCSYRERAPEEVRQKLAVYGLNAEEQQLVLTDLVAENFLDEKRFASAYAHGKLRNNKWGKIKIKQGLESHKVDQQCIEEALEGLSQQDYRETMINLLKKKERLINESDPFVRHHKIARFVISKGFEPELVWELLKSGEASR